MTACRMYSPGALKMTSLVAVPLTKRDADGEKVTLPLTGPRYFRHRTDMSSGFWVRGLSGLPSSVADTFSVSFSDRARLFTVGVSVTTGARFSPVAPSMVVFCRSMIDNGFKFATTLSVLPLDVSHQVSV